MVKLLPGFPAHVAAYVARGKVTADEYEGVVMRRVNEVAETFGKVNFLVRLETKVGNYTFASFLKYLTISFKQFSKWERMAIVTDEAWVREAYELLSPLVHGEIRGYKLSEYESACSWVSGPVKVKNEIAAVINSGIMGTSVMTAWSHVLSDVLQENFSEPNLLGELYKEWELPGHRWLSKIAGWHLHYGVGAFWSTLYSYLLKKGYINGKAGTSMLVGAGSGIISVAAWECMLRSAPRPPRIDKGKFYAQLVPGHVLFALIAIESLLDEDHT